MTTREPITQADLDGTSERGRAACQGRLRELRRMGLRLPPGAVIDGEPRDMFDDMGGPEAERIAKLDDADR